MTSLVLYLPLRLISEANNRDPWPVQRARAREQKDLVRMALTPRMRAPDLLGAPAYRVLITRIGKRKLDGDNLQRSAKAVRDGIAKVLEIDDGDDRIRWDYAQSIGERFGVRIEIAALSAAEKAG